MKENIKEGALTNRPDGKYYYSEQLVEVNPVSLLKIPIITKFEVIDSKICKLHNFPNGEDLDGYTKTDFRN